MQPIESSVEQRLADEGVRLTRGRRDTIITLAGMGGPRTVAEIHTAAPAIPLSSLYRSLAVLTEAGVLASHHGSDGATRFELAEWFTGHHHHLVCVSCGAVIDVAPTAEQEHTMTKLVEDMAAGSGFAVTGHRFEIEGVCSACR
jgi:Fur family ferric uptake transcriptional regulator